MRVSIAANQRYRVARLAAALATGLLYFWIIGIGDVKARFAWDSGLDTYYGLSTGGAVTGSNAVQGYYDLLGRSFANGKLRLPVEPSLDLLALANPWSDQMNRPYRLLDAVLFNEHYYLYHGPTPALLLFTPWYLITRHDLPENFAALALAFGSYLFFSALFTRALSTLTIRLPLAVYALFLLALGVSQSMPFLLHRVKVYEVAIACGCFCLSAGFLLHFQVADHCRKPRLVGCPFRSFVRFGDRIPSASGSGSRTCILPASLRRRTAARHGTAVHPERFTRLHRPGCSVRDGNFCL